jgi:hypothetical protein
MSTKFRALLGTECVGNTAISLLSSSLVPSTYANYDSALCHYIFFPPRKVCPHERHSGYYGSLHCMAGPTRHRGRKFYATLLFDGQQVLPGPPSTPIAVGDLLADARRGLEMQQQRLVPSETILPLLAPVALNILLAADKLHDNLA